MKRFIVVLACALIICVALVGCAETASASQVVVQTAEAQEGGWDTSLIVAVISLGSSLAVALISCVVSGISLSNSNRLTSYEYMIKHRLKTYSLLRNRFAKFIRSASVKFADANRGDMSESEYSELLENTMSDIEVVFSRTEAQEFLLLDECEELKRVALEYFRGGSDDEKETFARQAELVKIFVDIYMWTLWQYLQQIYKKAKRKYHGLFDKEFKKTFERMKKVYYHNKRSPYFFEKYEAAEAIMKVDEIEERDATETE